MKKRFLTMLLALVMVFSLFPTTALAGWGYGTGKHSTGKREPETPTVTWKGNRWDGTSGLEVKVTGADLKGKTLSVEKLGEDEAAQYFAAIEAAGGTLVDPIALDIKLKNGWKDYQPTGDVQVSITRSGVTLSDTVYHFAEEEADEEADEEVQPSVKSLPSLRGTLSSVGEDNVSGDVYEVDDDTDASVVPALKFKTLTSSTSGETVTVTTNHFSVYVVDETTVPRLTVQFKNGGTDIASMIVKATDTAEELKTIVYDPSGSMDLDDGVVFKGWTTEYPYTTGSTLLSIEQVRTAVKTQAASITEDTPVTYYAANFKSYVITYQSDDESPITVGTASVDYPAYQADGSEVSYTVNMGYTVDDKHNFEGWTADDTTSQSNIKDYPFGAASEPVVVNGTSTTVYYYKNNTGITITGDITFTVRAPEGTWLVFDETCNGTVKGATYTAPQFVLKGDPTQVPSTLNSMQCYGYTFDGWYDTAEHALAHAADTSVTTGAFAFGNTLETGTTIYASWIPNATANYTVLIWKQNIAGNGYDFVESKILSGTVGQTVDSVVQVGSEDDAYATINGTTYSYTGFHLGRFDSDVEIVPEGNAVVNVYFDRNTYVLTFEVQGSGTQYTRDDNGTWGYVDGTWVALGSEVVSTTTVDLYHLSQNQTHQNNQGQGDTYTGTVYADQNGTVATNPEYPNTYYRRQNTGNWWNPTYTYYALYWHTETVTYETKAYTYTDPVDGTEKTYTGPRFRIETVGNNGWHTVQTIVALYEQSIKKYFPIEGYENSRWSPQNSNTFNQVLVYIDIMPAEDVTFHQNTANYSTKHIHYYVEALEGETGTTREYNGKTFVLYKEVDANYNFFTEAEDYIDLVGFSKDSSFPPEAYNSSGQKQNTVWNNSNAINVYCYYLRDSYRVNYMDGIYVDGNNNTIQTRTSHQLTTSDLIAFGASLADCDITPTLPTGEEGYVFEGWYMDEACTSEYDFEHSTMPVNGVKVYAKWRQIQYRVFLHTGLTEIDDTELTWGSNNQALSFRVGYGGTVSTPTGQRNGYTFLGWYTAETGGSAWTDSTKLNSSTVTTDYDKENTPTDPETKSPDPDDPDNPDKGTPWYGPWDVETAGAYNSDANNNRTWITKRLDLYARWSKVLPGAPGINVVYNANGKDTEGNAVAGSDAPTDNAIYIDNSPVTAGVAASAPTGYVFDHWVVCTWDVDTSAYTYDANSVTVLPGMTFTIHAEDAKVVAVDSETNTYTVQLLAIYKKVEEETPTHIAWYSNYGEGKGELYRYDKKDNEGHDTLQINEAVTIYGLASGESVPTRSGYTFKGWTKTQGGTTADFLVWDGTQYKTASGKVATQVAADEKTPIEDLYAVWEAQYFYIFHSATGKLEPVILTGTIDLTAHVADNCLYGGYYKSYGPYAVTPDDKAQAAAAGEAVTVTDKTYDGSSLKYDGTNRYWVKTNVGTVNGTAIAASSLAVGDVLYLKEVPDVYLASRLSFTYDVLKANELVKLYLLTAVDDTYYTSVTFSVKSNYTAKLVSSFTITQRNSTNKSVNKATDFAGVERGYLGYCEASDLLELGAGSTFTVTPQWTTLDGVPVSGTSRKFKFESLTNTGIKDVTNTNP